jgi:hypothetical protein
MKIAIIGHGRQGTSELVSLLLEKGFAVNTDENRVEYLRETDSQFAKLLRCHKLEIHDEPPYLPKRKTWERTYRKSNWKRKRRGRRGN